MKALALVFTLLCSTLAAAPVSLFDGKTLEGWDHDPSVWRVEDGVITGGSTTEKIKANYFIATKQSYANFELRMKIKCSGDPKTGMINSGIQVRSVRVPGGAHMSGYQIDCGAGWFGKIYDEFRRNRVIWAPTPEQQAALDKVVDVFGWNEYRIRAEGPRIQTWINGVLCIDYTEADKNIALDGQIAPQVHSGGVALVQVKDVTIEELPPTPVAPTWESLGGVEAARKLVAPPKKPAATPAPAPPAKPRADVNSPVRTQRTAAQLAIQAEPRTAAAQREAFRLPEGFEIELVAQESEGIGKFVSVYFDQRGRLWTQTAFEYPVDGNENPAVAEALYKSPGKDKVLVYPREAINAPLPPGGLTNPAVFADSLAIPLGILPWSNGDTCYIQHGHDLKLFKDTNGDGKADTFDVILTGLGVQDSHLFPHQFTRAPGGWIWMAQGLFNNSKAQKPGDSKAVDWPKCSMAKMRPDGSQFEVTSVGPNNIWGLVITGEGESFIQEANDYGYPVMPFHEYAYYPGGMEALKRSYQPDFPPQAEFRMGGTGLSGLALGEGAFRKLTPTLKDDGLCMIVANPITSKVQTIAMHRDGPYWKLEQAPDLITCEDPFFRPVALTNGPDGCIYIVDWYNKIISHNEVPRAHPDRDKTRGRIWRVKPKGAKPVEVPDFTKLSDDELIAMLGTEPLGRSHLAWQAIGDLYREDKGLWKKLDNLVRAPAATAPKRIQALWSLQGIQEDDIWTMDYPELAQDKNPALRRAIAQMDRDNNDYTTIENASALRPLAKDSDPLVRASVIKTVGKRLDDKSGQSEDSIVSGIALLLDMTGAPLAEPTAPSSRNGKAIKIREAYDRDFERFLIRQILERAPRRLGMFLDSDAAKPLPVEARLLASLALEPKASAARVAKLLPQLQRAPGQEEVLRLAQFPEEPGVGEALKAILANPATRASTLDALLAVRTKLDAAKLAPFLTDASNSLLSGKDPSGIDLGVKLASGFALRGAEQTLVALAQSGPQASAAVRALAEIGSNQAELFAKLAETSTDALLRDEALAALASAKSADAPARVLALYPKLTAGQRKTALERLSATKPGASAILAALESGKLAKTDLDASILDRMQAVLGASDPSLNKLVESLGALFRPVLMLDGSDHAWTQTNVTFDGPCTIEAWVRLDPQGRKIGNNDSIAGAPGQLDFNFFGERARIYAFPPLGDVVVAKKPVTPGLWTHVAATRDATGVWKLYLDGELDSTGAKPAPGKIENVRLAWNGAKGGTQGALGEVRFWDHERTAVEVRTASDRSLPANTPGLVFTTAAGDWGQLQGGAKVVKTSDLPPILTREEAATLDAKYARFRALAEKPGSAEKGKVAALLCQACHLFGTTGGNIGPNLSGIGAMGTEAILRNILQPNAAMENGYRIFRVEMTNGDLIDAMFVSEEKDAVVVRVPGNDDRRLTKKDIRDAKFLRRSLMPGGLLDTMTPEQVSDLFAYFKTLK